MEKLYINYGVTAICDFSCIGWILPAIMLMFLRYSTDASVYYSVLICKWLNIRAHPTYTPIVS